MIVTVLLVTVILAVRRSAAAWSGTEPIVLGLVVPVKPDQSRARCADRSRRTRRIGQRRRFGRRQLSD